MTEILRLLFISVKDKLEGKFGCFEVFSVDFLLEMSDLSPKLMEVSTSPSYSFEMHASGEFLKTLLRDVITMVSDLHQVNKTTADKEYIQKVLECATQPYQIVYQE